jgi:hypothetical protein
MIKQVFDQMKGMTSAQLDKTDMSADARKSAEDVQARVMVLVEERMGKLQAMLVQVYADTYTEEEVEGILAFYNSPAGQAMLQKMPQLMQRSMAASQQLMGDLMPEIQKIAKEAAEKAKRNESSPPPK